MGYVIRTTRNDGKCGSSHYTGVDGETDFSKNNVKPFDNKEDANKFLNDFLKDYDNDEMERNHNIKVKSSIVKI